MQPLIYYPSFEPPDDIWLKFALLYFEEYRPIIPQTRSHLVSARFDQIRKETDLINPISPRYSDDFEATRRAINDTERYFKDSYRESYLFNRVNIVRRW